MVQSFAFLDGRTFIPFAHRGGTIGHPENTIEAFQAAVDLGYEYIETDVHASIDDELYAFHDDDLERVVGLPARIGELTAAEIDALRFDGYRIPRFDEVVFTWPTLHINVEPKSDAALGPLVRSVARHGLLERICLGSFSDRRIAWCRDQLGAGLCTSMGPLETVRLWLHSKGVATRPPLAACAQLPVDQRIFGRWRMDFSDPGFVHAAHDLGLAVHIWTVDDVAEMHRLIDCGVDGIMTDRPDVLRSVLIERGRWETGHD